MFVQINSIIGGILIACGIYLVLWGKAKEMKQKTQLVPTPPTEKKSEGSTDLELDNQNENKGKEEPALSHITII